MSRRRRTVAAVGATLLAVSVPSPGVAATDDGGTVRVAASNFRFCAAEPCNAGHQAYVRTDSGSLVDNAANFIEVRPGDTVTWHYEDTSCDALVAPVVTCPGHEVQFEMGQGSARGTVGTMHARSGPQSLSWRVPADAEPGDVIRYYCDLSDHWRLGVTGALRIVG